ncbi:esterase [Aquabacter sp. CN5-332]|uniref:esterase n=1 Tax=Aquabacter sp. CN5-332 TaxID=3156608 RepID=UPI0032B32C05
MSAAPPSDTFTVRDMGSFHIGGEIVSLAGMPQRHRISTPGGPVRPIEQNGEMAVGQMYVQYVRLAAPRSPVPVLMWHGGGMTGANWEGTPDGRPGWQTIFLRAGLDVFVSDAVERGRAGFAPSPEIYPEAPFFRTAEEAWTEVFRFGPHGSYHKDPALRRAYPGCRFPLKDFDAFMKSCVPRWSCNDERTQTAYDALVARMDHCVLLMHSQGGSFGFHAALHAPEKVKAVMALEPSGAPDPTVEDAGRLAGVPHLFIWGDHLGGSEFWVQYRPNVERWADALAKAGVPVEWIDLPARGITGNSHALMMDDNSDEIARMALDWLSGHGL